MRTRWRGKNKASTRQVLNEPINGVKKWLELDYLILTVLWVGRSLRSFLYRSPYNVPRPWGTGLLGLKYFDHCHTCLYKVPFSEKGGRNASGVVVNKGVGYNTCAPVNWRPPSNVFCFLGSGRSFHGPGYTTLRTRHENITTTYYSSFLYRLH